MEFNEHRPWLEGSGISLFVRLSSDKRRRLVKEFKEGDAGVNFSAAGRGKDLRTGGGQGTSPYWAHAKITITDL
jgi:hypothetical protein